MTFSWRQSGTLIWWYPVSPPVMASSMPVTSPAWPSTSPRPSAPSKSAIVLTSDSCYVLGSIVAPSWRALWAPRCQGRDRLFHYDVMVWMDAHSALLVLREGNPPVNGAPPPPPQSQKVNKVKIVRLSRYFTLNRERLKNTYELLNIWGLKK